MEVFVDVLIIDNSSIFGELIDKYRLCFCGVFVVVVIINEIDRVVRFVRSKYFILIVICRSILVTDEFFWSNEK